MTKLAFMFPGQGSFELGMGRGIPSEAQIAAGRNLNDDDLRRAWLEGLEVVKLALTERDFTFDGEFFPVERPTTIATRPLQDPLLQLQALPWLQHIREPLRSCLSSGPRSRSQMPAGLHR